MTAKRSDTHQIYKGVKKIRVKGRLSDYPRAIHVINSRLSGHFHYTPSEIYNINNVVKFPRECFKNELVWQCNVIISKSNLVKEFIHLKRNYSDCVLKGDIGSALGVLRTVEKNCGWSVWLIEAYFFCFQQTRGLEGNKEFLQKIYSERKVSDEFDLIYYLAFLISERNEDGCHVSEFHHRVNKIFYGIRDEDFKSHLSCVVNYLVFNDINKKINPEEYLSNFIRFPVIDIYELIVRVLVEYNDVIKHDNVRLPLRMLCGLGDKRLSRVSSLYGDEAGVELDKINGSFSVNLSYPQIYNYLLMLGHDFYIGGDFIEKFNLSMQSIINQDNGFDDAYIFTSQFSVNFKHIDEIYELLRMARVFLNVSDIVGIKKLASVYGVILSESELREKLSKYTEVENLDERLEIIRLTDSFDSISDVSSIVIHSVRAEFSSYITNYLFLLRFYSLMNEMSYSRAFRLYVDEYLHNNNVCRIVNLEAYLDGRSWKFYKEIDSYVDAAIVLDAYNKYKYDDKQIFNLKSCWRSFIKESGVTKPSELTLENFNGNFNKYFYFLSEVCTLEVIGSDASVYKSERDIKIERIVICNKLLEQELNVSIIEERDSLERSIAILDGLNEVEIAGLTVDQDRFKSVAKAKHNNDFNRYKSFVELMSNKEHPLKEEEKTSPEHSLITKPIDEGDKILINLIHSLGDMFLKNQEFGLDYYLSMRIRHGRLIGISRGPLERRRLVTKYSETDGKYLDNEYWFYKYNNFLDFDSLRKLNQILSDFSESFDNLVKGFKDNQVQIKTEDKPDGMFYIKITHGGLEIIKKAITPETTIDEFLTEITEYFLILIDQSSKEVKSWISSKFKKEINICLLNLQAGVEGLVKSNKGSINPISSEIASARTELNQIIDDISSWFEISSEDQTSIRTYTMENVIEISLARTKRIHQGFIPRVNKSIEIEGISFHSSVLALLVDALTIVFSNIFVHGKESEPEVNIKCKYIPQKNSKANVNVLISNPIEEKFVDFVRLKGIHQELESNQLKSRQEGGSGFHKLAAMPLISNSKDIRFGYNDGEFYVDLTFSLELL